MSDENKTAFKLPNKKLKLKPVKTVRGKNGEIHLKHEANHLFGNAKDTFEPAIFKKGRYVSPLTRDEQKFFENPEDSGLSFQPGDLAVDRPKGKNFWTSKRARLSLNEDTQHFDLNNAYDYLRYKILLTHPELIAATPDYLKEGNLNFRPTFRYVFVPDGHEKEEKAKEYYSEAEMWKFMFSIENDRTAMINMLTLLDPKKQVPKNADIKFLVGQLHKFLEKKPKEFYRFMKDEDLYVKAILKMAENKKLVTVSGTTYSLSTGEPLGENRTETIEFLKDEENQKVLDTLKIKLDLV